MFASRSLYRMLSTGTRARSNRIFQNPRRFVELEKPGKRYDEKRYDGRNKIWEFIGKSATLAFLLYVRDEIKEDRADREAAWWVNYFRRE